jgi:hypothetical protein
MALNITSRDINNPSNYYNKQTNRQTDNQTEAHKMTFGDGVAFAILGLTVLIWVNLQMMGVI